MVRSQNPLPKWPVLSLSSSMAPCFLFLLLLLLSATADGQRHDHWGHHFARHKSATSDAPSTQIRQACKAIRFPNISESILSDSNSLPPNPSPFDFILATTNASAAGLQTTCSMIQSILDASEKPRILTAPTPPAFASRSSLTSTVASPLPSPSPSPSAPSAMPMPGPAPPSFTSTTTGPASSMSTALPMFPMPWPSPPFPSPLLGTDTGSSLFLSDRTDIFHSVLNPDRLNREG